MMADDTDLQTACNSLWKTREDILDCIKYELDLMNSFSNRMVAKLYFNKIALDKNDISSAFNKVHILLCFYYTFYTSLSTDVRAPRMNLLMINSPELTISFVEKLTKRY